MNPRLILVIICFTLPFSLFAGISLGPIVGYNNTNGVAKVVGMRLPTSKDHGIIAGGAFAVPLLSGVGLQSGIQVSTDGFTILGLFVTSQSLKAYKLQVPLYLQYKTGKEESHHFVVGAGLYAAYNIYSSVSSFYDPSITDSLAQFIPIVQPFSFGYGVNAGFEMRNGLFIRLGYEHGLSNVFSPKSKVEVSFIPYQVNACVGYYIRKRR